MSKYIDQQEKWLLEPSMDDETYSVDADHQVNGAGGQPPAPGYPVDPYTRYEKIVDVLISTGSEPEVQWCGEHLRIYGEGVWDTLSKKDEPGFTAKLRSWLRRNRPDLLQGLRIKDFKGIHEIVIREPDLSVRKFKARNIRALGVKDLTFDFVIGGFREHRASDHLPFKLRWSSAQIEKARTSTLVRALLEQLSGGNDDKRKFLLAIPFVAATHYPSKMIPYIYGPSDTGKSLYVQLIRALFDDVQPVVVQIDKLAKKFRLEITQGASVISCGDYSGVQLKEAVVGVLKQLAGLDPISSDVKYKSDIVIEDKPLLIIIANFPMTPELLQNDLEAYRRFFQIPIFNIPAEQNETLLEEIKEDDDEMAYFVHEIIEVGKMIVSGKEPGLETDQKPRRVTVKGLYEKGVYPEHIARSGIETGESSPDTSGEEEAFDPEEEAWQEAEHLSEEQAAIRRFLIARIAKAGDATRTATAALYAAAKDFDAIFKEMKASQFGKLMREALDNADGVKYITPGNFRGFQGIRLKNPVEVTLPDSAE